jgi:hypothetical protein
MKHEVAAMTAEMRKTGIDIVGDMRWGTHVCLFSEIQKDHRTTFNFALPRMR